MDPNYTELTYQFNDDTFNWFWRKSKPDILSRCWLAPTDAGYGFTDIPVVTAPVARKHLTMIAMLMLLKT